MQKDRGPWGEAYWRLTLMAKNGLELSNVLLSRRLHCSPHYAPILQMFVTYRCNLRCTTCGVCYLEEERQPTPELDLAEWKAVVRSAAKLGTIIVVISGGEPLLRPELVIDLVRYLREHEITVHLCTNGLLIDRDYAVQLGNSGVQTVSISLESPDPELHEQIRGKGTFERAVNGIRLLKELAPSVQVGINHVITAENFRSMAAMVPFAESLGVHQLKFAPIHTNLLHKRKGLERFGSLLFKEEDIEELSVEVVRLREAMHKSRLLTTSPLFLAQVADLYVKPPRFRCFAGYVIGAIDPIGMVAPCADMNGVTSVRERPLEAIWRSPEFQEARKLVHNCNSPCWDIVNAELAIRLRPSSLIRDFWQTWKDMGFYFRKDDH